MALVLDTGVIIAAYDPGDRHYAACAKLLQAADEMLIVPSPVIPEADYFLRQAFGARALTEFIQNIQLGAVVVEELEFEDYTRVSELVDRYADADVGFVDASVLAVTERLQEPKLATLDRRHFSLMRPKHVKSLRLLPN
jgi:predicted nucleic acid-binding protein